MSETKLKRKFRDVVGVWSETYETRSGGGVGYPDLQLLVHSILVPVELKVKLRIANGRLFPKAIRPSQIAWHDVFLKAGGKSHIVVLWAGPEGLEAAALPGVNRELTSQWKAGYYLDQCQPWVVGGKLVIDLVDLLPKFSDKHIPTQ